MQPRATQERPFGFDGLRRGACSALNANGTANRMISYHENGSLAIFEIKLNLPGCIFLLILVVWTQSAFPQKASSPCLNEPCLNGGTCQEINTDYLCQCPTVPATPSDTRCRESEKPCQPTPCLGNTTCPSGTALEPECRCPAGAPAGSGVLSDPEAGRAYSCLCRAGHAGARCERPTGGCASRPCRNRALCRNGPTGPSCFCVPGFQGKRCEIEVNECASDPCRNGATCLNKIGRFACLCKPGYTGARCELQVDECRSEPCSNGGSCHDDVSRFSCTCAPGFGGDFCEVDVDECESHPCQNGGLCTDGANSYSCDCSESGFAGLNCDVPVPPCMSQPCLNSAPCLENKGNYTCNCWPGFEGRRCEVDTSECSSDPCVSGGRCVELSWKALYGVEPLLPAHYDPQNAEGFVCECPPGLQGALCEEDVNECDQSPCQNGGLCENRPGGYTCTCPPQNHDGRVYGGENCTELLVGCQDHECQNGGACLPLFTAGRHGHRCECPPGFSGLECQTPTSFSFDTGGHLRLEAPRPDSLASWSVALSFRTAHAGGLLFQRAAGGRLFQLGLSAGRLHLSEVVDSEPLVLPHNATDGEWHSVEAELGGGALRIRLLDEGCSVDCEKTAPAEVATEGLLEPGPAFQSIFIGGVGEKGNETQPNITKLLPPFLGCLRDLRVDSQLVLPGNWPSDSAVNVTHGCNGWDRCEGALCQNRGRCVSRWPGYQCECYRPYKGPDCSEEYVTARFGNDDSESYAKFVVDEDPGETVELSLFVRTRRPSAVLLALSNATGPYLQLGLEEGRVTARAGGTDSLRGEDPINDGHFHLVSVKIEGHQMVLAWSAQPQGAISAREVRVQPGDLVHVGGLPDAAVTASLGGYFKGCVQDLRIGSRPLQFYPPDKLGSRDAPESLVNVTRGCAPDDSCRGSPCLNGGMCYSMWDEFTCTCPPSTAGRRCEEVMWCEMSPCPPTADCQTLAQGFECVSNATFVDDISMVSFRGSGKISRSLTSVSFHIRTRVRDASVLRAEKGPELLALSIRDSSLTLELESRNHSLRLSVRSAVSASDGKWHSVTVSMVTPGAQASRWTIAVDDRDPSLSNVAAGNLDFVKEGAELVLGGPGFTGCLSTVEISGIALPYFSDAEVKLTRPQDDRFIKTSVAPALPGCSGPAVCAPDPCSNGGACEDLFDLFRCACPSSWAGPRCEAAVDACTPGPCVHGNCIAQGGEYTCACELGYVGADCEAEQDSCEQHQCAAGSTCLRGYQRYSCLCPPSKTGAFCDEEVEQVSWYIEHYPRPQFPASVCGGEQWNYTCFNGGNCTLMEASSQWGCQCMAGFIGQWCETDVDECASEPCYNGGYCLNMVNQYHCVCDLSYTGERCELNLNAESLTSEVLLSVCLATVALLLALSLAAAALVIVTKRRATHGTYSPSRLEKEGSRVEMWNMVQTPPMERLI